MTWRSLAEFTRYLDIHAAHLATCAGALDDADVGGNVSTVARWHPVGPARYAEGLTDIDGLYEL